VLSWGANPDTIDASGDTPLLWLLKNKPLGAGGPAQEIIKMLLRFGASPVAANEQDGNSPLHALCTVARPDLRVTFIIYQAAGAGGKYTKNKAGLTPHEVSLLTMRSQHLQ
jgi:ankyrin repeat protein